MNGEDDDSPRADPAVPNIMQLEVTNTNDFPITDRFDGIPYTFPVGESVTISPAVAYHLFGYPGEVADMAVHMAKRFGWSGRGFLRPEGTDQGEPRYVTLSKKIIITPIYYDLVRRERNAPIPADDGSEPDGSLEPVGEIEETTRVGTRKKTRTPVALGAAKRNARAAAKQKRKPGRDAVGR